MPLGITFFEDSNEKLERTFALETIQSRTLHYLNLMLNSVTYEVSHKRMKVQRVEYSLFEWFGDLGGLYGLYYEMIGPILVALLASDGANLSIASELTDMYTKKDVRDRKHSRNNCCHTIWLQFSNFLRWLLCKCCLKKTRRQLRIKQGRDFV